MRVLLASMTTLALSFPGGTSIAGSRSAESPLAEVPFDLHHNAVIVRATLDGRDELKLLLDTGWGPLALVSSTADRLKREPKRVPGELPRVEGGALAVGGAVRQNPSFEVFPVEELEPLIGPHDGVLSTAFFKEMVLQIDYPAGIVRFYAKSPIPSAAPSAAEDRVSVPMVFSPRAGALPFTDGMLLDGKPVRALLDTGGSGGFMAMKQLVERAKLEVLPDAGSGPRVAVGLLADDRATRARVQFARVGRIALGPFSVESPRVMIAPAQLEGDDWGHDLNVGYGFMRDYVVTFDYPGRTITFERPKVSRPRG